MVDLVVGYLVCCVLKALLIVNINIQQDDEAWIDVLVKGLRYMKRCVFNMLSC